MDKEIDRLQDALNGKELSSVANRWISGRLKTLGTTTINLGVEKSIARRLGDVVDSHNLVRDAFFNRLILFLRSPDALLKHLGLPIQKDRSILKSHVDIDMPLSPLANLRETFHDPLWYIHEAILEVQEIHAYLLPFSSPDMSGFTCWIDDKYVPSTGAYKQREREEEEFTRTFEAFELSAFSRKEGGE